MDSNDYVAYGPSSAFGAEHPILIILGILIVLFIIIKVYGYFARKAAKNDFQQKVFEEFQADHVAAAEKYFPTEEEIRFYQQLYQNQQAQTQTASAMANVAYASGGENFLASVGQIGSSFNASNARKRLQLIYSVLFYASKAWEEIHSPNYSIEQIVIYCVELAYYKQMALESGIIPYGTTPLRSIYASNNHKNLPSKY